MKATIQGIQVEGTPEELAEFIRANPTSPRALSVVQPVKRKYTKHTYISVPVPMTGMRTRKIRKGGMRFKPWTAQEDQFMRENYAVIGGKKCAKALRRTIGAIKVHACNLGIKSGKHLRLEKRKHKVFSHGMRAWSEEELAELKLLRPQLESDRATRRQTLKDFAQRHNRTVKGVTVRANTAGYSLYRK